MNSSLDKIVPVNIVQENALPPVASGHDMIHRRRGIECAACGAYGGDRLVRFMYQDQRTGPRYGLAPTTILFHQKAFLLSGTVTMMAAAEAFVRSAYSHRPSLINARNLPV